MRGIGNNIYKRKDGRYEGRYIDGTKPDGRPRYRSVYGKSVGEVAAKLNEAQKKLAENILISGLTVNDLISEWLCSIRGRVKESTVANYKMKIEKHIIPVFGSLACEKLSSVKIYDFIERKISEGLSTRYVSDIVVLLKSVFKNASIEHGIFNPIANVRTPRKKRAEIKLLSKRERKTLEDYTDLNPDLTSLGISLSMYTGIRIGELCALKWGDVDLEKGTLTVRKTIQRIRCEKGGVRTRLVISEPKSESSLRTIPVPARILTLLRRFSSDNDYFILSDKTTPIEPRTMQYRFKTILKREKLPSIHFHALRHMFATNCIELGFDVKSLSEILGHSSVEVTLNRYVHSSFERKRALMQNFAFDR